MFNDANIKFGYENSSGERLEIIDFSMEDDWLNIKVNNEFPIILEPYEKVSFVFEMDIVTTQLDNVMYMTPHITLADGRSLK